MTHNKRPGPKTNQEEVLVNKQLLVLISQHQYDQLTILSDNSDRSKSDLVREALDNYFNFKK